MSTPDQSPAGTPAQPTPPPPPHSAAWPAQPPPPPPPPGAGAPGWHQPPPGAGVPGWPAPPADPGTNKPAVTSLVLGLLTPCGGIPGVLSIVFGTIALLQIAKTGQRGRWMAIVGMAATVVWVVVIALVIAAAVIFNPNADRDSSGQIVSEGRVSVDKLMTGDCLRELPDDGVIRSMTGVPCAEQHRGQVYGTFDLPGGTYPGETAVFGQADEGCLDRLAEFPAAYDDPSVDVFYIYPTRATWRSGDREVVCIAEYLDGPRTGSLVD